MNARAELFTGLVFGSLMLASAYVLKHAGVDRDLPMRVTMVLLGLYYVVSGNALPRRFTARAAQRPNADRIQAGQRFAGWTFVLAGLAFALVWIVLPTGVAEPLSVAFLVGGSLTVFVRTYRACRSGG
jgi:hypothetical protein